MSSALSDLLAQVTGRNPEEEERIKKNAEQGIAQEEARTGEKFVDEPGIEPDEITNTAIDLGTGGTSGLVRRVGTMAAGKATNAGLNKLKESGMPNKPQAFHEAVAAGREPGSPSFSKFIRGEDTPPPIGSMKKGSYQVPSKGQEVWKKPGIISTSPEGKGRIAQLQEAYQEAANRGTREGDMQAKHLLGQIRQLRDARME